MKPLKHVTFSIREDHVDLLNEISDRYSMRSRSAALSFVIQEYVRLSNKELLKNTHAVYVDTDSIKQLQSVDKSLCMYDHAGAILEGMEDTGKDKEV